MNTSVGLYRSDYSGRPSEHSLLVSQNLPKPEEVNSLFLDKVNIPGNTQSRLPQELKQSINAYLVANGLPANNLTQALARVEMVAAVAAQRGDGPQLASALEQIVNSVRAAYCTGLLQEQVLSNQLAQNELDLRRGNINNQTFANRQRFVNLRLTEVRGKLNAVRLIADRTNTILNLNISLVGNAERLQRLQNVVQGYDAAHTQLLFTHQTRQVDAENTEFSAYNTQLSTAGLVQKTQQNQRDWYNTQVASLYKTPVALAAAREEAKKNNGLLLPPALVDTREIDPKLRKQLLDLQARGQAMNPIEFRQEKDRLNRTLGPNSKPGGLVQLSQEQRLAFARWMAPLAFSPTLTLSDKVQAAGQLSASDYKPGDALRVANDPKYLAGIQKMTEGLPNAKAAYQRFTNALKQNNNSIFSTSNKDNVALTPEAKNLLVQMNEEFKGFYAGATPPTAESFAQMKKNAMEKVANDLKASPESKLYAEQWLKFNQQAEKMARENPQKRAGFMATVAGIDLGLKVAEAQSSGNFGSLLSLGQYVNLAMQMWETGTRKDANAIGGNQRYLALMTTIDSLKLSQRRNAIADSNISLSQRNNETAQDISKTSYENNKKVIADLKTQWESLKIAEQNVQVNLQREGASQVMLEESRQQFAMLRSQLQATIEMAQSGLAFSEVRRNLTQTQSKVTLNQNNFQLTVSALQQWNQAAFSSYQNSDAPMLGAVQKDAHGVIARLGETTEEAWMAFLNEHPEIQRLVGNVTNMTDIRNKNFGVWLAMQFMGGNTRSINQLPLSPDKLFTTDSFSQQAASSNPLASLKSGNTAPSSTYKPSTIEPQNLDLNSSN